MFQFYILRRLSHYTGPARCYSDTTRIYTGLSQDPTAPHSLQTIYEATQAQLGQLPECYYRRTLSETVEERLGQLRRGESTETWGEGHVEELVEQAKSELAMIQRMVAGEWRPWEELECPPPPGQWEA